MKKIFSFDAETNGLWGQAFSIGAIVYQGSHETDSFVARLPDAAITDDWVIENVLPAIQGVPVTHDSYYAMLKSFSEFYLKNKDGADIIVHMGVPVEAKIVIDMVCLKCIGEQDGPYPLFDIASNMQQVGENPTSVDDYVKKHNIKISGKTHNPLYDASVAAAVYRHLGH